MVAYIFDALLTKGVRAGHIPARTKAARTWYRNKSRRDRPGNSITDTKIMAGNQAKLTNVLLPGRMIFYAYDAKHKKTLPYYDRFPCVFPFKKLDDGFLGINMHYLPMQLRARLMDALYNLASDTRYNKQTILNLSYGVLNSAATSKWFKPTVHRYLSTQIRSRFMAIDSVEWDIALFLPLERFMGASNQKVWADSRKKMKK